MGVNITASYLALAFITLYFGLFNDLFFANYFP
jgi:hypothetical protein